jgi:hypothetical protein
MLSVKKKKISNSTHSILHSIETSKSLVQKVFGPKFHRNFPTERRKAKGSCKEGVWPTTTQQTYRTTGVDLALGKGQSVNTDWLALCGMCHVQSLLRLKIYFNLAKAYEYKGCSNMNISLFNIVNT